MVWTWRRHPKKSPAVWTTATIPGCRSGRCVAVTMSCRATFRPAQQSSPSSSRWRRKYGRSIHGIVKVQSTRPRVRDLLGEQGAEDRAAFGGTRRTQPAALAVEGVEALLPLALDLLVIALDELTILSLRDHVDHVPKSRLLPILSGQQEESVRRVECFR